MCLQALEEQTYPKTSYEVIVVDNGSDENIESVIVEFHQAKEAYEPHPGSYAARNKGLSLAKGEIMAFTNSDCIPAPDWIEKGVAHLLHTPHCGLVGGKVVVSFQNPNKPTAIELYEKIMYFNQKMFLEQQKFSLTANLFTFRHIVEQVGYFADDLKSSGDKEWGRRVASHGYRLVYADDACVIHPARQTFEQLHRKVVRLAGGFEDLSRKQTTLFFLRLNRESLLNCLPPVISVFRIEPEYRLTKEKITVILIWFVMKYVELRERLKHRLKGEQSKR